MKLRSSKFSGVWGCSCAIFAVGVLLSGCEWESSGSDNSWDDSMSWANFSGLYRSGSDTRALVSNFSISSGGTASDDDTDTEYNETPVAGQTGPTKSGPFTTVADVINFINRGTAGWSIKPGSVSITITGNATGPVGSFTDSGGSGTLSGSYSQVPGGPTFTGTGLIEYDTGAWSLSLSATDPFIEEATVTYSYVVLEDTGTSGGSTSTDDEDPPTSHGWVYTLQIEQTGNKLRFTDNRGFTWDGIIVSMTTPSGDKTGRSPGDVIGSFEVTGNSNSGYRITGTFSGTYTVATSDDVGGVVGQLTARRIQGIWIEPTGNGDLYGETADGDSVSLAISSN